MKHWVAGSHVVACERHELKLNYLTALPLGLNLDLDKEAFRVSF